MGSPVLVPSYIKARSALWFLLNSAILKFKPFSKFIGTFLNPVNPKSSSGISYFSPLNVSPVTAFVSLKTCA